MPATLTSHLSAALQGCLAPLGIRAMRISPNKVRGLDPFRDLQTLLRRHPRPTIFDVGANCGETVEQFLEHFPAAEVVAFEPFSACAEALRCRFATRPNVRVEGMALGAVAGTGRLNVFSGSNMNSLLPFERVAENVLRDSFSVVGTAPVQIETLDGFCARHHVPRIDILKVDTQGYDLEVLKGGGDLLSNHRIRTVFLEVNFIPMYRRQAQFTELHEFLAARGYRLVDFYHHERHDGYIAWCDACYVATSEPAPMTVVRN